MAPSPPTTLSGPSAHRASMMARRLPSRPATCGWQQGSLLTRREAWQTRRQAEARQLAAFEPCQVRAVAWSGEGHSSHNHKPRQAEPRNRGWVMASSPLRQLAAGRRQRRRFPTECATWCRWLARSRQATPVPPAHRHALRPRAACLLRHPAAARLHGAQGHVLAAREKVHLFLGPGLRFGPRGSGL